VHQGEGATGGSGGMAARGSMKADLQIKSGEENRYGQRDNMKKL
jgi:hypothetical protein